MQEQKTYHAAIYARLSKEDEQRGDSASIETQVEMLTRYVRENGWDLAASYKDDGYSGTSFDNRPAFQEMMARVEKGEINLIVVKDLSRFGRNYLEMGKYTELILPSYGCRFISVGDNYDSIRNDNSDMLSIFKNVMNDFYSRDISQKIRTAAKSSYKSGKYLGACAPFGYAKAPDDPHRFIIDEPAAAIVRRIFGMRSQGMGYHRIAVILNEEGVLSPREYYYSTTGKANPYQKGNGQWSDVGVRCILTNEAYIGHMVQHKSERRSYKDRRIITVPQEERIRVENTHEPIISMELWEQCRRMDRAPIQPRQNGLKEICLFSGLLYCAECGAAMRGQIIRRRLKNNETACYENYLCGSFSRSGHTACTAHNISRRVLSELVLYDIWSKATAVHMSEKEIVQLLTEKKQTQSRQELAAMKKSIKVLQKRTAELDRLIQSTYEDKVKGTIPSELCTELFCNYQRERAEKKAELLEMDKRLENIQKMQNDAQEWVSLIKKYRNIDQLDRDTLLRLIDKIEVGEIHTVNGQKERNIRVHYKFVGYIG